MLARVTHLGQPGAQLEVDRARRLAAVGCPVGALEPHVDPLEYARDGFVVTLWVYYEPVTPRLSDVAYAEALARLHAGIRRVELASPRFTDRIAEAAKVVADPDLSPELAATDRVFLGETLGRLGRTIQDRGAVEQLLHGEPHPGNVLSTRDGPLFIDFETICRGPVEFDLAHVPEAVCEHYPNVDHEFVDECRHLVLAMVAAWRWELGDEFPNGQRWGRQLLRTLREGPPWPTLDTITKRMADR